MLRRSAIFAVWTVISLLAGGRIDAQEVKVGAAPAESNARRRLDLAREAYEHLYESTLDEFLAPPHPDRPSPVASRLDAKKAEEFALWSRRWMEAERALKGAEALKGHAERMRDLASGGIIKEFARRADPKAAVDDKAEEGLEGYMKETFPVFTRSMTFFRLEAEALLLDAPKPGSP